MQSNTMENNEITMCMDVKVDKRPEITRYQQWTRAQVKMEAVKCLPCFLRITLTDVSNENEHQNLILLINVPGVNITLCSSRTKQHSYALCWTQNRKCCYIYFALDTESSWKRHIKWVKKSIKNLELHRKLLLDERRCSRGSALTALPQLDHLNDDSVWSQRVSEIYEEIYEPQDLQATHSRRVSRRCSRTSIASGIYEEMKFPIDLPNNFNAINEEVPTTPVAPIPPPLPPFPPQRKRFNTYDTDEIPSSPLAEAPIVRCNTNPETDLAKKKKHKNMLENIFHVNGLRSKRTVSTSESSHEHLGTTTSSTKQSKTKVSNKTKATKLLSPTLPNFDPPPIYANDDTIAAKRQKKPKRYEPVLSATHSKRNSFSSPDLSKINFIDTFDEQRIAEMLNPSFLKCDDFDLANSMSLDESVLLPAIKANKSTKTFMQQELLERDNISMQLPQNFNFSACNTSSVNLIASLSSQNHEQKQTQLTKNKIIHDDLTGYCVMAPIVKKMSAIDNTPLPTSTTTAVNIIVRPLETVSSGYSTGSYSSTASSTEEQKAADQRKDLADESVVYMNMEEPTSALKEIATPPLLAADFTGNLYENLLAIKAARELEPDSMPCNNVLGTSTPTESPLLQVPILATTKTTPTSTKIIITTENQETEEESYYQTPRRSIISIDEKIPSYYPNTCESSIKSRRRSYSPAKAYNQNIGIEKTTPTTTTSAVEKTAVTPSSASSSGGGLRQLVSSKLRRERKENLYLTSPQCIIEQRIKVTKSNASATNATIKTKKAAALKISENVYAVKHRLKKSVATDVDHTESYKTKRHHHVNNNNTVSASKNSNEAIENQYDVLDHLAILRNIDFQFEDATNSETSTTTTHHLQVNQSSNTCHKLKASSIGVKSIVAMTQSAVIPKAAVPDIASPQSPTTTTTTSGGMKKFASLPRFKKFDLSPLRMRINNVLQRNQTPEL